MGTEVKHLPSFIGSHPSFSEQSIHVIDVIHLLHFSFPIGMASDLVYKFALRMRVVKPFPSSAGDLEGGFNSAPGGARAEAERRRYHDPELS
jgi:hypothetical protein